MKGFTFIEFIIYIAITAFILVVITGFLWLIVSGSIKESSFQEVQHNGRFALTKITQEIKKAVSINNPPAGAPASSLLSLAMADPNLNPTVFDLNGGKLRITQGSNPSQLLTTDQVAINSLQFTNLTYATTPGTIRVELTLDYNNPANRVEYEASTNLVSTISLVSGGAVPPSLEILRPTGFVDIALRTTGPQLAFDGVNGTTFAATVYRETGDSIIFDTWQTPTQSYTSLALKYRYHADAATDDMYAVAYSTNAGFSWTDLISLTSSGAPDTTVSVTLSSFQDLSQLQVKIYTDQVTGPDNANIHTRDIWTEGAF